MYSNAKAVLLNATLISEKRWKQIVSMEYHMVIIFELGNWQNDATYIFFELQRKYWWFRRLAVLNLSIFAGPTCGPFTENKNSDEVKEEVAVFLKLLELRESRSTIWAHVGDCKVSVSVKNKIPWTGLIVSPHYREYHGFVLGWEGAILPLCRATMVYFASTNIAHYFRAT